MNTFIRLAKQCSRHQKARQGNMIATKGTLTMNRPEARFWDRMADRYARRPVTDEASYQKKLQMTHALLRPDMKVLEFGCGTGSTALVHSPLVDRIVAIDISGRMIEIASEKAVAAGVENVEFIQSTLDDFQGADESFDVVLGLSILHWLNDRDTAMAKVHRLLKPGGVFISSTPCLGDTMKFFKLIGPLGRWLGLLPLLRVFTSHELSHSLETAGFRIEQQWSPAKGKAVFMVARKSG